MSPTSERLALRPSVEARVQLDRVELLRVPAEPVCGCQRGLVQDGVPVVIAPSRRPDADVTHSSPIAFSPNRSRFGPGQPASRKQEPPRSRLPPCRRHSQRRRRPGPGRRQERRHLVLKRSWAHGCAPTPWRQIGPLSRSVNHTVGTPGCPSGCSHQRCVLKLRRGRGPWRRLQAGSQRRSGNLRHSAFWVVRSLFGSPARRADHRDGRRTHPR